MAYSSGTGLCFLIVSIISLGLLIWGFVETMKVKQAGESDAAVVQRQLRGFAFILLAQVVSFFGAVVCMGGSFVGRTMASKRLI